MTSKTPDEWAAFRTRTGEFKQWLHTIHYGHNATGDIRPMTVWAPLPWVWHDKPDGGVLLAMANLGILDKCPGDWSRMRTSARNIRAVSGNVYWVLCRTPGIEPLKQFLASARRRHVTTEDMIAEFDRKRVLFRKQ